MARKKKTKAMDPNPYGFRLMEGENVLYSARPGRRMDLFFLLIFLALAGVVTALYFLGAWGLRVNNPAGGGSSISVASVGVVALVGIVFYRFAVMGHFFMITDRRVIVMKGPKHLSRKFLDLDLIGGAKSTKASSTISSVWPRSTSSRPRAHPRRKTS